MHLSRSIDPIWCALPIDPFEYFSDLCTYGCRYSRIRYPEYLPLFRLNEILMENMLCYFIDQILSVLFDDSLILLHISSWMSIIMDDSFDRSLRVDTSPSVSSSSHLEKNLVEFGDNNSFVRSSFG